jgi:hypothetical protein
VIPVDEAIAYLKDQIKKMFGKRATNIVKMNNEAVDKTLDNLVKVEYPDSWADAGLVAATASDEPEWVTERDEAHAGPAGRQTAGERLLAGRHFPVATTSMKNAAWPSTCPNGSWTTASSATSAPWSVPTRPSARCWSPTMK